MFALGHEIVVHHEDGVDGLVDARGAEGVTDNVRVGAVPHKLGVDLRLAFLGVSL